MVAKLLGCSPCTVSSWKKRGLPAGRAIELATLARAYGLHLEVSRRRDGQIRLRRVTG
jgi:uncharacterized protein YjcR